MESVRVQAKFIIASSERVLHPGQLVIRHGRVTELTSSLEQHADIDLGEVVLIPGLVNAHTHLEFSDVPRPFPPGSDFPTWISSVVRHRSQQHASPDFETQRIQTLQLGAQECFASGTVLIGDIVTQPWTAQDLAGSSDSKVDGDVPAIGLEVQRHLNPLGFPRVFAFAEVIGLTRERLESSAEWAKNAVGSGDLGPVSLHQVGVSPHAPYSLLHPSAINRCLDFDRQVPLAMHLAESLDEREWAENGTGAFRAAFEKIGIPCPTSRMQLSDAIALLATRERSLLIHGNYLKHSEMDDIARNGNTSIVYCPRTHQHFGHSHYPLKQFQARSIPVVLGTDSRASNPDLNLWSEMVTARSLHSEFSAEAALASITSLPARALGCEQDFGSLDVGKLAFLNILPCEPDMTPGNVLERITTSDCQPQPLFRYLEANQP